MTELKIEMILKRGGTLINGKTHSLENYQRVKHLVRRLIMLTKSILQWKII